ncbi:MAG: DJ-1/PfpI family protein [Proteobacteria bacterium]|nr:DJ-1/PfpI family protein [Pseudomonadota bacterium]
MNIGIYIYDNAEVLDFSGPFEVFTTATRICGDEKPFNVFMIGETGEMVTARAGYQVKPNYKFDDHPPIDVLIVAGGFHYEEVKKATVLDWITQQADQARFVASVCSGTWLLAEAGVVTNQNVTTHWDDISMLRQQYPDLSVLENARWIDEGKIITSAGISAGIDMSLHLVGKFHSVRLAEKTARQMEYKWERN